MATRRLTDAFLLMRNNAIQNRQILAEQVSTNDPRLSTRSNAAVSGLHRFDILLCVCILASHPELSAKCSCVRLSLLLSSYVCFHIHYHHHHHIIHIINSIVNICKPVRLTKKRRESPVRSRVISSIYSGDGGNEENEMLATVACAILHSTTFY